MARNRYNYQQQMHLWRRSLDQRDRAARDFARDEEQADIALGRAHSTARGILDKAKKDIEGIREKAKKDATTAESGILSRPRLMFRGATIGVPYIWVTHHQAVMPETLRAELKAGAGDVHNFLRLQPGGGAGLDSLAPAVIARACPHLTNDRDFREWQVAVEGLVSDTTTRYPMLGSLRNDVTMAHLFRSVGVLPPTVDGTHERTGKYGRYPYKLSVQDIPSLVSVHIGRGGLELTYGHITGESAKDWASKIDKLRAVFGNMGVNSRELNVSDGADGSVHLRFNDRDPFEGLTGGVITPYDTENGKSYVGQSADGGEVWLTWQNNALALVAGMQSGGKTASMLPVLAGLAGHAELHLLDGNSSGEWAALEPICASYDESGELPALAELIESLFPVARDRLKRVTRATGEINFWDVPAQRREALGLYPIVVAVEEAPQYLSKNQLTKDDKAAAERNMTAVGKAVKLFRKSGITVLLIVQKPTADEIPTVVRDMAGGRLCFRLDSDTAAATVLGDAAYIEPKPSSIPPKKPGRFVARVDARGSVLGQAPYVPIGTIREALVGATPVPDQRGLSRPTDSAEVVEVAESPDDKIGESAEEAPEPPAMTDEELMAEMQRRGLAEKKPAPARKPRKAAPRKTAAPAEKTEPAEPTEPAPAPDHGGYEL